jgi:hypothetical protein
MGNSTDIKAALGSINLGNGLIEIAALTSLIGSTAAESLALGDKGPGGLAWAMMTIFGALSVVKLFIATTIPGWLRESVGVRSARSDAVVGSSLNLNKSFKSRGRGEPAKAVECEIQIVSSDLFSKVMMLIRLRIRKAERWETPLSSVNAERYMSSTNVPPIF